MIIDTMRFEEYPSLELVREIAKFETMKYRINYY